MKKVIAFHLPQFHPVPENDIWWGDGFTEWTNVKKAKPLFEGHHQPNIPGELGYYDLSDPSVLQKQADLASESGIHGFCYWHYWFGNGKRLLEKPIDEMLNSGKPDFPFMLGWANQTWTGIWHGASDRILIEQKYPGKEDVINHCTLLQKHFDDKRYIRINDRPLFYIYDPFSKGFTDEYMEIYKDVFHTKFKIEPYFILKTAVYTDKMIRGIADAYTVEPFHLMRDNGVSLPYWFYRKVIGKVNLLGNTLGLNGKIIGHGAYKVDYLKAINFIRRNYYSDDQIPTIIPNWDNTPRSGKDGWVALNSNPETFGKHLSDILSADRRGDFKDLYFLKSWNEWAEGNYLEPDKRFGDAYLKTLKSMINNS